MRYGLYVAGACALMLLLFSSSPTAGPPYGPWSEPVNLGPSINSSYVDHSPLLSREGLSLYFSSNRPCGEGDSNLDFNLWVARRSAEDMPWAAPKCLSINIDGYEDSAPAFSRDGHWMFFVSTRPGGLGTAGMPEGRDLWVTWRAHVHDDHAWQEPFNAGAILNFSAREDAWTSTHRPPRPRTRHRGRAPRLWDEQVNATTCSRSQTRRSAARIIPAE